MTCQSSSMLILDSRDRQGNIQLPCIPAMLANFTIICCKTSGKLAQRFCFNLWCFWIPVKESFNYYLLLWTEAYLFTGSQFAMQFQLKVDLFLKVIVVKTSSYDDLAYIILYNQLAFGVLAKCSTIEVLDLWQHLTTLNYHILPSDPNRN